MTTSEPAHAAGPTLPRYSTRPLPPFRYVPGQSPHPVSDPAGPAFGHAVTTPLPLSDANWRRHETWLYAADLFNHGYYWEAHEAWESLWHAAGRKGREADLFKGLIKLAAAGVKLYEKRPAGIQRHAARAAELLSPLVPKERFGLSVAKVLAAAQQIAQGGAEGNSRLPLTLVLDFTPT